MGVINTQLITLYTPNYLVIIWMLIVTPFTYFISKIEN